MLLHHPTTLQLLAQERRARLLESAARFRLRPPTPRQRARTTARLPLPLPEPAPL